MGKLRSNVPSASDSRVSIHHCWHIVSRVSWLFDDNWIFRGHSAGEKNSLPRRRLLSNARSKVKMIWLSVLFLDSNYAIQL